MGRLAVRVEGLGKMYRVGARRARYKALRDVLVDSMMAPIRRVRAMLTGRAASASDLREIIWALKDVSLEVEKGEVIGIIGRNGAGKTTLLKILSRITEPTEGYAEIHGRVGSLLEVGTGFHPELTGRENVYLSGAILGMKRAEIERKFDEIIAFAGMERFVDTPVKFYSSGMYVRLAFAVAAHLEPEILLVDEVLAVGDLAFQKKCLGKMENVAHGGRTVLFVSHDMAAIQGLCNRVYLLDDGHLVESGSPAEVIAAYVERFQSAQGIPLAERDDREGNGAFRFTEVVLRDAGWNPVDIVYSGQHVIISVRYTSGDGKPLRNVAISIPFYTVLGRYMFMCWTELTGSSFDELPPEGWVHCHIPRLPLTAGNYPFNLFGTADGLIADWVLRAGTLKVAEGDFFGTGHLPPGEHNRHSFLVDHFWELEGEST